MTLITKCPRCSNTKTFDLDEAAYLQWQRGQLVQKAFPDLNADDRERLISGTCPACWDRMFGED